MKHFYKKKKRYIKNATPHLVNDLTYLWRPVKNAMSSLRYLMMHPTKRPLGTVNISHLNNTFSLICTFPTSYTHLSTLQLVTYIHCISGTSWWITLHSHNSEPPKKKKKSTHQVYRYSLLTCLNKTIITLGPYIN